MRVNACRFLTLVLFAAAASGQTSTDQSVDRVISLASIEKAQELSEIATTIRSIAEIRSLTVDPSQRSLAVHGTAEQIAMAESLAQELAPRPGQSRDAYEYRMSSGDLVRVYYLAHTATVQDFQAVATTIRSITELRWAFTYNARRALVVRGTLAHMEMTEWLVQQLDQPASGQTASNEYRVPGAADDVVHVYSVKHVAGGQNLQELATLVRSIGDIRRLFTTPLAVAMRGTSEEMALADWLLQKLDQPTSGPDVAEQSQGGREFLMARSGDVVRVFYLRSVTVRDFQDVASAVRTTSKAPHVVTYNALGALAVRGTADQIAVAQGLIDERLKSSQP
jgi:type II secretory pathway component GspD/PulD (secretin)